MQVTVLGTSSPYPRPGDPCSSFLVEHDGARLLLDIGSGALAAALAHASLEDLDALWVSHTHADHFSDIGVLYYALRYSGVERPPLPVFGPPGWADRLRAFVSHRATPNAVEQAFEVHEVADGQRMRVAGIAVTAVRMQHDAPCFGVRMEAGGRVLACTGDTGPHAGLEVLATGADLLVAEAGNGLGPESDGHLTAHEAGGVAARSGARLLLTHLAGADPEACADAARAAGARDVVAAHPGLVVPV